MQLSICSLPPDWISNPFTKTLTQFPTSWSWPDVRRADVAGVLILAARVRGIRPRMAVDPRNTAIPSLVGPRNPKSIAATSVIRHRLLGVNQVAREDEGDVSF